MDQVSQMVLEYVVSGLLTLLSGALVLFVKKGLQYLSDKTSNEAYKHVLSEVDGLIETNIVSVENTLKPKLLEAIADGKIDKSELSELSKVVQQSVFKQLSAKNTEVLNKNLGDSQDYVQHRIEKVLEDLKNAPDNSVQRTVIESSVQPEPQPVAVVEEDSYIIPR